MDDKSPENYNESTAAISLPLQTARYFDCSENVVFVMSLALNALLAVVLVSERNKTLRVYSRVLLQGCFCDAAFMTAAFTTKTKSEYNNGHILVLIGGFYENLSSDWQYFGYTTYVFGMLLSILSIPIVFYFRYLLIVRNVTLTSHQLLKIILSLIALCVLITALSAASFIADRDASAEKCRAILAHPLWTYGGRRVDNCLVSKLNDALLMTAFAISGASNAIMYAVMIYCTTATFATLSEKQASMSAKTVRLQTQLNRVLIVQFITPTICGVLPMSVSIVLLLARLNVPGVMLVVLMMYSWVPLVNPTITMLLVASYRRKCARICLSPLAALFKVKIFALKDPTNFSVSHVDDKPQIH